MSEHRKILSEAEVEALLRRAYRAGVDDARSGLSNADWSYYDEPSKEEEDQAISKILRGDSA